MLGLLSPDGEYYKCGFYGHINLADKLLKEVYEKESNRSVDTICKLGWVVLQSSFVGFAGDDAYMTPALTRKQREWLEDNECNMSYDQRLGLKLCFEINDMMYE